MGKRSIFDALAGSNRHASTTLSRDAFVIFVLAPDRALKFTILRRRQSLDDLMWAPYQDQSRSSAMTTPIGHQCFAFGGSLLNDSPSSTSRRRASDRDGESLSTAHRSIARMRLSGILTP